MRPRTANSLTCKSTSEARVGKEYEKDPAAREVASVPHAVRRLSLGRRHRDSSGDLYSFRSELRGLAQLPLQRGGQTFGPHREVLFGVDGLTGQCQDARPAQLVLKLGPDDPHRPAHTLDQRQAWDVVAASDELDHPP